jgi:hypothetical protein
VAEFTYTIYSVPDNMYGVYDHDTKVRLMLFNDLTIKSLNIYVHCAVYLPRIYMMNVWEMQFQMFSFLEKSYNYTVLSSNNVQ